MIIIITVDELVMRQCANFGGTGKIFILKTSVGLVTVQFLLQQIIYTTNALRLGGTAEFDEVDTSQRIYCKYLFMI